MVLGTAYCRVGCDGAAVWKNRILELMFSRFKRPRFGNYTTV
jgi:hypothetical protein